MAGLFMQRHGLRNAVPCQCCETSYRRVINPGLTDDSSDHPKPARVMVPFFGRVSLPGFFECMCDQRSAEHGQEVFHLPEIPGNKSSPEARSGPSSLFLMQPLRHGGWLLARFPKTATCINAPTPTTNKVKQGNGQPSAFSGTKIRKQSSSVGNAPQGSSPSKKRRLEKGLLPRPRT